MAELSLDSYRLLGRSGLRVSPLSLGTMTFGKEWGWGSNKETSKTIFDRYADEGGNFIDTANFYTFGTSEKWLGEFINSDREWFVLSTKYTINMKTGGGREGRPDPNAGGNHRKNIVQSVEASLKRLSTEYIDLYWLHMWDYSTPVDELMRALDDLVRSGKVLYLAISDTPAWKIAQCNTYAEAHGLSRFIATQVKYNLLHREVERDILPACRELGVGLLPWSPLAGGLLTGKYGWDDLKEQENSSEKKGNFEGENRNIPLDEQTLKAVDVLKEVSGELDRSPSQVALRWLLEQEGVTSVIIGARKLSQLEDNLGCLSFDLEASAIEKLEEAFPADLGFPHSFIQSILSGDLITGRAKIDLPIPY